MGSMAEGRWSSMHSHGSPRQASPSRSVLGSVLGSPLGSVLGKDLLGSFHGSTGYSPLGSLRGDSQVMSPGGEGPSPAGSNLSKSPVVPPLALSSTSVSHQESRPAVDASSRRR